MGRPRLHPTTPKKSLKTSLAHPPTTEALTMAIQSIMPSLSLPLVTSHNTTIGEVISSYEVMPNMDLRPITSQSLNSINSAAINQSNHRNKITVTMQQRPVQKIKVLSPKQFVKIKPPSLNTQKVYSLKTSPKVSPQSLYTVRTQSADSSGVCKITSDPLLGTNKVFTVKSTPAGTQLLSTSSSSFKNQTGATAAMKPNNSLIISPKKYTIMKPPITTIQQPHLVKISTSSAATSQSKNAPDLSTTNIFDIPIVFADNDGNIQDNSGTDNSNITQINEHTHTTIQMSNNQHTSSNQPQNRNIIINSIASKLNPNNKVLLINRGMIKGNQVQTSGVANPLSNITVVASPTTGVLNTTTSNSIPALLKYTKVNVSNASSINLPVRNNVDMRSIPAKLAPVVNNFKATSFALGSKVELINNSIVKTSAVHSMPITHTVTSNNHQSSSAISKLQPIVINVDSDKTTIKNMIKVGETQIKPSNTILIKPGGLRPIPMLRPGILNRSLTVRKVVNIVQQKTPSNGQNANIQDKAEYDN